MTDTPAPSALVVTPGISIDPMSALASSIHASSGLYAVLVGSGISRSAGQPGAWEVLDKLIMSYATAQGKYLEATELNSSDWWFKTTGEQASYSRVLAQLEPTRGGRQERIAAFFQHATPSSAHRDLARLCLTGRVQVIITTNFDRLIEQALTTLGVHFQVVNQDNVTGMMPLVRGLTTVFKVNGDYLSLAMRNTSPELSRYTRPLTTRLREVFRDFGLVVVGWSGQWDTALRKLIEANSTRNYPIYWVAHQGVVCDDAQRLIDNRGAYQIASNGANESFRELSARLQRLDQLGRQRKTTRRALRYHLHSPNHRILQASLPPREIWISTVVELGPTIADETGYIDPPERQQIAASLRQADITIELTNLLCKGAVLSRESWPNSPTWDISSEDDLNRDEVGFRSQPQGGRCDLTARSLFKTPAAIGAGDNLLAIFDIGVSGFGDLYGSRRKLSLEEVAVLVLDQFAIQAEILSQTLHHLTVESANLRKVEFHLYVPPRKGNSPAGNVGNYVNLECLGSDGRESNQMSVAFPLSEPLTRQDQIELVIEGIRHIALSYGYSNPDPGIANLKSAFEHQYPKTLDRSSPTTIE